MKRLRLGIKYLSGRLSGGYLGDEPRESGEVGGKEANRG